MGLIDDNKKIQNEIFPSINESSPIYSYLNYLNNILSMNNDYNIPINETNKYFNSSNYILSEFAKIYFHLLPCITMEQTKYNQFLNQSFLIAYEYNESLNEIEDKNYFYFAYPKSNSMYNNENNFHPGNLMTNPNIYKSNRKIINPGSKNKRNGYAEENWFSQQDFLFRNNSK